MEPLEPVRADHRRMREALFDVVPIGGAALLLVHRLHEAGGESTLRYADVELADQHGQSRQLVRTIQRPARRRITIDVDAEHIEPACGAEHFLVRVAPEPDSEIEVTG